jgi:hypothetical protein
MLLALYVLNDNDNDDDNNNINNNNVISSVRS